ARRRARSFRPCLLLSRSSLTHRACPAKPGLARPGGATQEVGVPAMDISLRGPLWIVATGVLAAGLYFLREPLTQFALALILWLAIDGLTASLDKRIAFMPRWLALPIALVLVLGLVALIGYVVVHNLTGIAGDIDRYEFRLNQV